ncbi:MAG: hypothetical protein BZY88_00640 [SAR202 cluster bacterium Io17-Chloro-G9]|nr:MAG: hypothetical protein BZY88_00640 [SAR202 cluster bacterium Io17-Chloro-G9]
MTRRSINDSYKPWFDLSILIVAHLLLLPLWILLWTSIPLLIWLGDRGPIFYRQKRSGKDGHVITILKFRTMVPDADRTGPAWTTEDDPRLTRVGKILRRTALDELPETLSIWKGEMSLVGPRALDLEEQQALEQQIPNFAARLQVRPGLTGLAQIYDRNDVSENKFYYDLEYLDRMGPWLDLRLLVLSVWNTVMARWDRRGGKPAAGEAPPASTQSLGQGHQPSGGVHETQKEKESGHS